MRPEVKEAIQAVVENVCTLTDTYVGGFTACGLQYSLERLFEIFEESLKIERGPFSYD